MTKSTYSKEQYLDERRALKEAGQPHMAVVELNPGVGLDYQGLQKLKGELKAQGIEANETHGGLQIAVTAENYDIVQGILATHNTALQLGDTFSSSFLQARLEEKNLPG